MLPYAARWTCLFFVAVFNCVCVFLIHVYRIHETSSLWFVTIVCRCKTFCVDFCKLHFTSAWFGCTSRDLTAAFFISVIYFLWFTQFRLLELTVYDFCATTLIDVIIYVLWFYVRGCWRPSCCGCLYILADFIAVVTFWIFKIISVTMDDLPFDSFQRNLKCSFISFLRGVVHDLSWMYFAPFLSCCVYF